jgi:hypothetical protein
MNLSSLAPVSAPLAGSLTMSGCVGGATKKTRKRDRRRADPGSLSGAEADSLLLALLLYAVSCLTEAAGLAMVLWRW